MTGVFNAKKLVTWHVIAPAYGAMTAMTMGMLPWIAHIRYHHQAHQPTTGLTTMTGVGDPPPDIIVTPDVHTMTTETDLDSVALSLAPVTTAIGVVATRTLAEVAPDHSTDLPIATSPMTEALAPTTAATMTHLIADLHLTGIAPDMTADLDIDPGNNTTNLPKDPHHLGNLRTGNTNRSQLMTPHQNTIAQVKMTVNQMMI